jgi:hypothetical protein
MSKELYSLKIFILREEFKLTKKKKIILFRVGICIVIINLYSYIKVWCNAKIATFLPRHNLEFLKYVYENIDEEISKSVLKKLKTINGLKLQKIFFWHF